MNDSHLLIHYALEGNVPKLEVNTNAIVILNAIAIDNIIIVEPLYSGHLKMSLLERWPHFMG